MASDARCERNPPRHLEVLTSAASAHLLIVHTANREREGFESLADAQRLDFLDLCWLTNSEGAQLFVLGTRRHSEGHS